MSADSDLSRRIDRLETAYIRFVAIAGFVATTLGLVMTIWLEEDTDDGPVTARLITLPFLAFGDTSGESLAIVLGIGFLGLLIVQVVCLWTFLVAFFRMGSERLRRVAAVCAGLSAVGSFVPSLFWLIIRVGDDGDATAGPGVWPLWAGVFLALWLTLSAVTDLWVNE